MTWTLARNDAANPTEWPPSVSYSSVNVLQAWVSQQRTPSPFIVVHFLTYFEALASPTSSVFSCVLSMFHTWPQFLIKTYIAIVIALLSSCTKVADPLFSCSLLIRELPFIVCNSIAFIYLSIDSISACTTLKSFNFAKAGAAELWSEGTLPAGNMNGFWPIEL